MKKEKTRKGVCTYCGEYAVLTRDHVFPKGLFKPLPTDPVIVDSCSNCNEKYSLDEEFIRTIIAARATFVPEGKQLWKHVVSSSFCRSPKFKSSISELVEMAEVTKGGIYLGNLPALVLRHDEMTRFKNVIDKIIKGLYFHHFDQILPINYKIITHMLDDAFLSDPSSGNVLQIVWPKLGKVHTIGGGRVKYRYRNVQGNEEASLWSVLFYDRILFYAIVYPEHMEEQF